MRPSASGISFASVEAEKHLAFGCGSFKGDTGEGCDRPAMFRVYRFREQRLGGCGENGIVKSSLKVVLYKASFYLLDEKYTYLMLFLFCLLFGFDIVVVYASEMLINLVDNCLGL